MTDSRQTRLSRTVSHALRHEPWLYELELDEGGWTPVDDLVAALRRERRWRDVDRRELATMVAENAKQRYELDGDRIRARYGHSVPGRIVTEPGTPPRELFHGTAEATAAEILRQGLRPMSRQYVHLSVERTMAVSVGRRKGDRVTVLSVDTVAACALGVEFLRGNEFVWLAEHVPAACIRAAGHD